MPLFATVSKFAKKGIANIGIVFGFAAATAVGILGGIDAALMFPAVKLPLGLIIGGSSCFVNAVSYFYVVSRKDAADALIIRPTVIHRNTFGSTIFVIAATFFIGTTFVANFVGMYIGFTVLGGKLNLHWPRLVLQISGSIFGVSSAISGLIFNVKVAYTLWNRIRETVIANLPESERPLLIQVEDNLTEKNTSTNNLRRRLTYQITNTNIITTVSPGKEEINNLVTKIKFGAASIKPSFFMRRNNKLILPITSFEEPDHISRHKRSNSM